VLQSVLQATYDAGKRIEAVRASGVTVRDKADASPVTEADHAADEILHTRLLALADIGWLSEETVDAPERLQASDLWIVDPLDGTREFIMGLPEYTVAVALIRDGQPALGVVHNPSTDDTFWAERGKGAFRNGKPIRVVEGPRLLASRSELKRGEFEPFNAEWDVQPVGSIEYKLALIAAGDGAVTLSRGPKHEWDVCAGALIVEEAGGRATDLFGGPLIYNQSFPKVRGILAGAPGAYDRAATRIAESGASDRMGEFADIPRTSR